jgi:type IV pilus assembly protein PilX
MKAHAHTSFTRRPRARERGAALFIALVVLVALSMAGIAMMRSVDTATLVAGNIGFRQSTINAADVGIQAAGNYIFPRMSALATQLADDSANGYTGITPLGEPPDWYLSPNNVGWKNAVSCNGGSPATACTTFGPGGTAVDISGNTVTYVIHRLCDSTGALCGSSPTTPSAGSGGGQDMSAPPLTIPPPSQHFRVTVRVNGPRNSVAYVQTLVRGQ